MLKKTFTTKIFSPLDLIIWGLLCVAFNITVAMIFTGKIELTSGATIIVGGLILGIMEYVKNRTEQWKRRIKKKGFKMLEYSDANARLIETTNPLMEQFLGKTGHLMDYTEWVLEQVKLRPQVGGSAYFDMLTTYMYTSQIQDIEETEDKVILKTRNSVYTFEKIKNENFELL